MNNLFINALIIIVIILFLRKYFFKENFEENTEITQKQKLAISIYNFIKKDSNYIDYLTFLTNNPNNLSEELLKEENFYEFLFKKKSNMLNVSDILNKITDME
jgi:hypothetical protein